MQRMLARDYPWLSRLQDRGDFYRQIVETTCEGIWVIDAAAHTAFVNEQMASMLGYTIAGMFGKHLFTFMDDEGKVICEENLKRRQQGVREQHEFKLQHKDGRPVWVLMSTSPLCDEQGTYAGALAMVNDITEHKCAAVELERAKAELELRVAERTRELTELNRKLAELATRDPLTGLLNRRAFDERLAQEVATATRYSTALSLLLLDVDHFKAINDSAGHAAGDEALRRLGCVLASHLRKSDVLARIGGEEFVILAPHTPHSGAQILAERLRLAVAKSLQDVRPSGLTVSVGIAVLGERASSPAGILGVADAAMYAAKRDGRNCISG
jgi:diguanylate cyclase (GGDEF)-like protein/PAS domain S-box-containing protein